MRRAALVPLVFLAVAGTAAAQDPPGGFHERFVLDTGRVEHDTKDPGVIHLGIHGEHQLRYHAMSTLQLQPPVGRPSANTLGQHQYLEHWLRVGLRLDILRRLALVGQIDVPRGMVVGDATQHVDSTRDARAAAKWYDVAPRELYLEYASPIGVFRVGQQAAHWGMGIVANDGDHDTLFGDHRRGALVERFSYTVTPMGKGTPLFIFVAGDLVFQDAVADLLSGDHAFQGVAAIGYRTRDAEVGIYGVGRHQTRDATSFAQGTPFTEHLTAGIVDVAARFNVPVPSAAAFAYGAAEVAVVFGSTSMVRGAWGSAVDPTAPRDDERLRSLGGAAVLGAVRVAGTGADRWGQVLGEVELGYASGDADPYDGVTKRFTFDEDHHVGLLLFDHVLRWKTARAATLAADPSIVARGAPGRDLLPSRGGVFGAQYVNPRVVLRPRRWVDLKAGVLIAQTTADLVDPYHADMFGSARNYDGGDPRKHDLGVEIDAGATFRIKAGPEATVQMGVEGGVLFPGHAFDDPAGRRLDNQYLGTVHLGARF